MEAVGDALLVHKCQTVFIYTIIWNQTVNNSCYTTFPVLLPGYLKPYFLDVSTRRLHSQGHQTSCPPRIKPTFIVDIKGNLWSLSLDNKFTKIHTQHDHKLLAHINLPKLAHFSPKLLLRPKATFSFALTTINGG